MNYLAAELRGIEYLTLNLFQDLLEQMLKQVQHDQLNRSRASRN